MNSKPAVVTEPSMLLLNNTFDPITRAIAFFHAPLSVVANELIDWRTQLCGRRRVQYTDLTKMTLPELLHALEPIVISSDARELLVSTTNPEWTAYFSGNIGGADEAPVSYLAKALACKAMFVSSSIPAPPNNDEHANGGTQFILLADHRTEWLNHERAVGVGQDGSRWRFGEQGTVQDFENTEAYQRRTVRERFTHAMLVDYCAALGLHPYDEDFYTTPATLVVSQQGITPPRGMSLAEARRHLSLDT